MALVFEKLPVEAIGLILGFLPRADLANFLRANRLAERLSTPVLYQRLFIPSLNGADFSIRGMDLDEVLTWAATEAQVGTIQKVLRVDESLDNNLTIRGPMTSYLSDSLCLVHVAAMYGHGNVIRLLAQEGVEVDDTGYRHPLGRPITCATTRDAIEALVSCGVSAKSEPRDSRSTMTTAISWGADVEAVKCFMSLGCSPNEDRYYTEVSVTALPGFAAILKKKPEVLTVLLDAGLEVSDPRLPGFYLLQRAISLHEDNFEICYPFIKTLIAYGANPDSAFMTATDAPEPKPFVQMLLEAGADPNPPPHGGEVEDMLLGSPDVHDIVKSPMQNLIFTAIKFVDLQDASQFPCIQMLVERGVPVDGPMEHSTTLHRLLKLEWYDAWGQGTPSAVLFLLENGADIHALAPHHYDSTRCTMLPIHSFLKDRYFYTTNFAIGRLALGDLILRRLLDPQTVNAQDHKGRTPLMLCCGMDLEFRADEFIEILMDHGADLNAVDHKGQTALDYFLRTAKYIDSPYPHMHTEPDGCTFQQCIARLDKMLAPENTNLNVPNRFRHIKGTPIFSAVKWALALPKLYAFRTHILDKLFFRGADLLYEQSNTTVLHLACARADVHVVNYLLKRGAWRLVNVVKEGKVPWEMLWQHNDRKCRLKTELVIEGMLLDVGAVLRADWPDRVCEKRRRLII